MKFHNFATEVMDFFPNKGSFLLKTSELTSYFFPLYNTLKNIDCPDWEMAFFIIVNVLMKFSAEGDSIYILHHDINKVRASLAYGHNCSWQPGPGGELISIERHFIQKGDIELSISTIKKENLDLYSGRIVFLLSASFPKIKKVIERAVASKSGLFVLLRLDASETRHLQTMITEIGEVSVCLWRDMADGVAIAAFTWGITPYEI